MPNKLNRLLNKDEELHIFSVQGQSLISARWIGLLGQTITIFVAYYGLDFDIPFIQCLLFIIFSGLVNNYAIAKGHDHNISESTALTYLSFDVLHLTILLYLTGGIGNPFYVLLLAPVLIGASLLPKRDMAILLVLGITCTLYISFFHLPLKWPEKGLHSEMEKEKLRMIAESLGLGITLIFASFYGWKISEEGRKMQKANFAARTALLKQKQTQALGAQAAAAVHELGSPLGTISIIAKELLDECQNSSVSEEAKEDMNTLVGQTERCRQILTNFGKNRTSDPTYMAGLLDTKTLLQNIADGFLLERPGIRFIINSETTDTTGLPQSPEITHGLGVFIQNAIQFAQTKVMVTLSGEHDLQITIEDDGPGFSPLILPKLGQPYTSSRLNNGRNMGLGVFIAQTLLEETGATMSYDNKKSGGASIIIYWTQEKLQDLRNM